jgi:hypothetical protein
VWWEGLVSVVIVIALKLLLCWGGVRQTNRRILPIPYKVHRSISGGLEVRFTVYHVGIAMNVLPLRALSLWSNNTCRAHTDTDNG